MRRTYGCLLLVLCAVSSAWRSPVAANEELADRIAAVTDSPPYHQSHWGLLVVDRQTGEVLYEKNADKLFVPASAAKLFTVAAALVEFGSDYRFQTRIVRNGSVDRDGTLEGDLILIASGDLTLGGRTLPDGSIAYTNVDHIYANGANEATLTTPDPLAGLNELARQVAAAGIGKIEGDVLIDDRLFDRELGSGSGPEIISPIVVNDNVIDLTIGPTKAGETASLKLRPESKSTNFRNNVQTVERDGELTLEIQRGFRRISIVGTIPEGHPPVVRIYDRRFPAWHAQNLLVEALGRAGVEVEEKTSRRERFGFGSQRNLPDRAQVARMPQVARFTSPPFSESAKLILKVSHNLHASTLPLLLAARHGKQTLDEGLKIQARHLRSLGIDVDTISFGGGAGGDRADYVTPRATVALLQAVAEQPFAEQYRAALPVLGVDGTLADMLPHESPARGKVQAKTGTLYWNNRMSSGYVLTGKALAGYATTASNRELTFAILVNNVLLESDDQTTMVGRTLAELCEVLYDAF